MTSKLFFSATTLLFYDVNCHSVGNIPSDAKATNRETHRQIMAEHAAGKVISANADGDPVTVDRSGPTADDLKMLAKLALEKSDIIGLRCFKSGVKFPKEWRDYECGLRAVIRGERVDLPEAPAKPENI